jgi:hypothetical protein
MELKKPVINIGFNETEIVKQFSSDEYLLIDSEEKKVELYSGGQITQGYSQFNLAKKTFLKAEANKKSLIKIDSPLTGITMDVLYKKWVID